MYFLFANKTCSQITKEPGGFKKHIFKIVFSDVCEPMDKYLYLFD